MKVITLPPSLEERTFDPIVQAVAGADGDRPLFDARHLRWVDPYGIIGLLVLAEWAAREGRQPRLQLPDSPDVTSYLSRMGFFEHATSLFEFHGGVRRPRTRGRSEVLLEVTAIRSYDDVHAVVDRVNAQAQAILTQQLAYPGAEAFQFGVLLSEVCQNILEHAQAPGWVAVQTYSRTPRLDRRTVKLAVMDLGVGFKGSLASAHAARFGKEWSDVAALEAAFIHGMTRFHDPGRGQGLKQMRKQVGRWGGKVSIRSGTARIADVPEWDDAAPLEERLPFLPGAQIGIILPARGGDPERQGRTGAPR
ncbi:MAG TPA: ATP-binding protein [Longimicrobiales bacterium]